MQTLTAQQAVDRARQLLDRAAGRRVLIGIAGAPGSGKSTLASAILARVEGSAVLPMDGFHLAHSVLTARGDVADKGAPTTFDAHGYLALLQRVAAGGQQTIWAPEFRREAEDAVAGAVAIEPDHRLVVTEGNYLLLDTEPWHRVRELCDEVWFLLPDEELRVERLVARHVHFGRTPDEARTRALTGTDGRNAALVADGRERADVLVVG